ncbi:MAG: alcohol dehydrogenase [Candidatus Dadabacteria bacterium]|nr:MAG: alcohol dehydrogenase [Candidatus Dadabacteria bacterium]
MKAMYFDTHGGVDVLKIGSVPDPKPRAGEILLKVKACALNHLDIWVREGWPGLNLSMPHITGSDIAGEIVEFGEGYSGDFKVGDRVVVNPGIITKADKWVYMGEESVSPNYQIIGENRWGGLAEFVSVPAQNLLLIPDGVDFCEACAPVLVGITSWRMLLKRAGLQPGETVLIIGAGGGVNSMSLLLSLALGARVIVLAGGKKKAKKAEELGAHIVIDYKRDQRWWKTVLEATDGNGADIVIDNVGAPTFLGSIKAAARGGRIVTVGNTKGHEITYDNRLVFVKQISILGSTMGSDEDFRSVMRFIWERGIKPVIDCVESLDCGIEMVERLERGEQFGKIVLIP